MKNKLFAIALSLLMILSAIPTSAIGMVSIETPDEITTTDVANAATLTSTEFPASAPENAVLYEDFETCTLKEASTLFTYADESYAETLVAPGEQWPAGLSEAPVSNGKSWRIDATNGSKGATSISIKALPLTEVGKYRLSYKIYADFEKGAFGNLMHFVRLGNPDFTTGNFFDTTWTTENTVQTWVTKTYHYEVYIEDGVKYIKSTETGATQALNDTGKLFIRMYCFLGATPTKENPATFYFDDLCVEKLVPVSVSFADANGDNFDYEVPSQVGYVDVTMPTAADLGVSYEPKFTDSLGNEYVSGEKITVTKNAVFTVSESDIVLKDSFDSHTLTTYTAKLPVAYARGNFSDAYIAHAKIYKYEHAEGNAFRQDSVTTGMTPAIANSVSFAAPGKYTISFEVGIDSDDFVVADSGAETTVKAHSFTVWARGNSTYDLKGPFTTISSDKPTVDLTYTIDVYERAEDGVLCFLDRDNKEVEASAITSIRPAMAGVYPEGTAASDRAKHYIFIDDFMIKYTPYAPTTLKLAGYKAAETEDDDFGIRFASYVNDTQINNCNELGYIVTRKSFIETDGNPDYAKLTLDGISDVSYTDTTSGVNNNGVKIVAKAAYNENGMRVYAKDGTIFSEELRGIYDTFFTGLLVGIPDTAKDVVFVARPYAKINGVYYYGECHETSYNELYNKSNA